jgi:hypothetical protein
MAFLHVVRGTAGDRLPSAERTSAAGKQSTLLKVIFEFVGTFFVLLGIAVGILTLRFALVLMYGVPH